ncbi:carbohydrate-binding family 9-like protein [Parapedobacter deserti]|uniref:Carbohydrate-binding family 9-like protein n=1 Tax=Parapedobacter deserti TaxID=1912957 RepID=A0ABV7JME7_9SPHI
MKQLVIPFLEAVDYSSSARRLWEASATLMANKLDEVPWPSFPYKPLVQFRAAHTIDSLLLVYDVSEKHVKGVYRNTNDPVYRDSCVEFFLSFDGTNYYNLEFNCLGVGLIAYGGTDKGMRRLLPNATVEKVRAISELGAVRGKGADNQWRLLLNIPFTVFDAHAVDSLAGRRCHGNFYKCGDDLPIPHFIAWNGIDSPTPNFHLPEFFGELLFL